MREHPSPRMDRKIPHTTPDTHYTAEQLQKCEDTKCGKMFEVRCCYCKQLHPHDYGLTDPLNPIITPRVAPCNQQPYTIHWD